jgi:sterol desaturase/sphingolipid hydroxylase (fatty acid hydroxylase superfamily)
MARNFVSNKDETPRMFENDILEFMSKVHWSVPLFVFLPIVFYFLYKSIFIFSITFLQIFSLIIFGLIIWTFTEYSLHRFIFHYNPKSDFGKRLHFMFHGVHHDYPNDSKRLVMPPSVSIPLATMFFYLFLYILGEIKVYPFFIGFISGYLFYDITHYAIHHFNMKNKFWLYIKNHHMKHHYQNPGLGYGVSQPTWDFIFGTSFPNSNRKQY